MATKTLTATVKLNTSQAVNQIDALVKKINSIDNIVTKTGSNNGISRAVGAGDRAAQKLNKTFYKQWWQTQLTSHALDGQVKTIGQGDAAAQRLAKSTARRRATEYELWWQTQLVNQEYRTAHPLISKLADKLKVNKDNTQQWASAQTAVLQKLNSSKSALSGIWTKLKGIIGMYAGIQGMGLMIKTSDTITSAENRLNALDGGSPELTEKTMDKIYAASQRARTSYSKMMDGASKTMTIAGEAFQGNMDNAIRFEEIMAKSYTIAGASAEEQTNSMYQLRQALGSGILAGDELRSVREQAPLMYKEIEKFAQGVFDCSDSLKDMAADGMITSELVVAAVMKSGNKIDDKFKDTATTFAQAWNKIKNVGVQTMRKVSDSLEKTLNSDTGKKAIEGICIALVWLGNALATVVDVFARFFGWFVDNWGWLKHVVVGAIIAMIAYQIIKTGISIFCAYMEMKAWMAANSVTWTTIGLLIMILAVLAIVVSAVLALVYVFILWKNGAIDTCNAIVTALMIVGIAILLVGIITGNMIIITIGLVVAAIGLIVKYLDYFLGIVYSIGAAIYNIVVGVIDGILQLVWACIEPIISVVEWILNVCNGGFNDFGGAVANLIGQIISWFLSLGKVVTKIIDAIFGTNWTAGLNSLQDSVLSWGKNENAITLTREAPTIESMTGGALPDRISYTDAWNKGMEHGAAAQDWMNDIGSQFQSAGQDPASLLEQLPKTDDPSLALDGAYAAPTDDYLREIAGDTGDIKDAVDLADEELEWMRKIADMEWRNEFTTAEIKVSMTNNNTINGDRDLDGIVEYLSDALREEMASTAYGVHY